MKIQEKRSLVRVEVCWRGPQYSWRGSDGRGGGSVCRLSDRYTRSICRCTSPAMEVGHPRSAGGGSSAYRYYFDKGGCGSGSYWDSSVFSGRRSAIRGRRCRIS